MNTFRSTQTPSRDTSSREAISQVPQSVLPDNLRLSYWIPISSTSKINVEPAGMPGWEILP